MPRRVPPDPHLVLGVERGASRAEITRAFRTRARALHPDVSGADTTAEMAALAAARDDLLRHAPVVSAARRAPGPRERPEWATGHDGVWTDYWASWWDPPKRPPE